MEKKYILLASLFVITLAARLFLAFQTPYLSSDDAYFTLRQVEHITETGFPVFQDELSYGGKLNIFLPFFEYILAIFALFLPKIFVLKLIPNIFASLLVFFVYLIAKEITKNEAAALFTSFISAFIPIFFSETVNTASVYSIMAVLMLAMIYCLLKIEQSKYIIAFIALMFVSVVMHPSAIISVVGLLFYMLLIKIERLKQSRIEIELILFSTFFTTWFNFLVFKQAFLLHGSKVIWQNVPIQILTYYFSKIGILEAIYGIGIIPFLAGIYIIYAYAFKEKRKALYLLIGFAFSIFILLWLLLLQLKVGLIFLGIILTLLFAQFYKIIFTYIRKTKLAHYEQYFIILLAIIFVITSIMPSLGYAEKSIKLATTQEEIDALLWLKNNTNPNSTILASFEEGNQITAIAKRKNVMDSNFLFVKNIKQRFIDVKTMFTSFQETTAVKLLNKYKVDYIYFSKRTKNFYGIKNLRYVEDKNCFELVYSNQVRIYKTKCRLEEV